MSESGAPGWGPHLCAPPYPGAAQGAGQVGAYSLPKVAPGSPPSPAAAAPGGGGGASRDRAWAPLGCVPGPRGRGGRATRGPGPRRRQLLTSARSAGQRPRKAVGQRL